MLRDIHALMKNTYNPDAKVSGHIKNHVRLENQSPQSWRKLARIAAEHGILCQRAKPLMQAVEIRPRLLQSKIVDREFVDSLKIARCF